MIKMIKMFPFVIHKLSQIHCSSPSLKLLLLTILTAPHHPYSSSPSLKLLLLTILTNNQYSPPQHTIHQAWGSLALSHKWNKHTICTKNQYSLPEHTLPLAWGLSHPHSELNFCSSDISFLSVIQVHQFKYSYICIPKGNKKYLSSVL